MTIYRDKILKLRNTLGISQKEFALMCGFSVSSVAQYETGARNPSKKALYKICEVYEKKPSYFDLTEDSPYNPVRKEDKMDSRVTTELMNTIDSQRQELRQYRTEKRVKELEQITQESMGQDVWVYIAQLRRSGALKFERKIVDSGNGMDIFTRLLGYSKEEAETFLSDEWVPAMPLWGDHPIYNVISQNTFKHLYRIFLKLPSIMSSLEDGGNVALPHMPFEFKHKNGKTITTSCAYTIDVKELTVSCTTYFYDQELEN